MANDYVTMQDRIADEVIPGYASAAASGLEAQIQREILSAVRHYERQRFWFNEARATASTVAGQVNLAVPTDLLEIDRLDLTLSDGLKIPLCRVDWRTFEDRGGADTGLSAGQPCEYAYYADQLWFYPMPDAVYTLTLSYVKRLTALSAGTDSNSWTTDGEELIRSRAAASVLARVRQDPDARQEMMTFAARGEPYLSALEKIAHLSLLAMSRKRNAVGRLMTHLPVPGRYFDIRRG